MTLSNSLVNRGYKEVITYSFISNEMHDLVDPKAKKILLKIQSQMIWR